MKSQPNSVTTLRLMYLWSFALFFLTSCTTINHPSADGYDVLIGKEDELTPEERQRIWEYLLQYADQETDFTDGVGRREAFRMEMLFRRIGLWYGEEPFRHFYTMKSPDDQEYHVLISVSYFQHPGEATVEFNVYHQGAVLAGTRFIATPTNLQTWLGDITVQKEVEGLGDVLKVDTHYIGHIVSLYFALFPTDSRLRTDGLGLVRIANSKGIPNGIFFDSAGYDGPAFRNYWKKHVDQYLKEGPVNEQLQLLLWLASSHPGAEGDGLNNKDFDQPDTAEELRAYVAEHNLLVPLLESDHPWVKQAALLLKSKLDGFEFYVDENGKEYRPKWAPVPTAGDPFVNPPFGNDYSIGTQNREPEDASSDPEPTEK